MNIGRRTILIAGVALAILITACGTGASLRPSSVYRETGLASYYAPTFHGSKTASGETYRNDAFTAAHPTLPFGSTVNVINTRNGRTVRVRINDRGPFVEGRIIDLSVAAARELGMLADGLTEVRIVQVDE